MANHLQYREILEGAEGLSVEEQETLVEILKSRLRERRRVVSGCSGGAKRIRRRALPASYARRIDERDSLVKRVLLKSSAFVRAARKFCKTDLEAADDLKSTLQLAKPQ